MTDQSITSIRKWKLNIWAEEYIVRNSRITLDFISLIEVTTIQKVSLKLLIRSRITNENENKFGKDSQCDLWKNTLPPVVSNTFYYNKMKDSKDSLQSPQINLNRDYYHSQKHMSEKFQQFLYLEKLKNEEGYKTKFGEGGSSNIQFNGRIEGNGIRQRQFLQEDNDQRRYQEETQDTNKPSYYMQMMKTGLSVVNGSQSIKNTDAFIEILKRHNNCWENRGHSIGYNQSSADGNI